MSLVLEKDYEQELRSAKPLFMPQRTIRPPPGVLGAVTVIPAVTIPPVNTDIRFQNILPPYKIAEHPGLAAIDTAILPENFNWKDDGEEKSKWIADSGNQMLCGSCWAISVAGVVADNFVVRGLTKWKPHLSTTWCLACYPQAKCQGGNTAILLQDIARGGIATENCIDYSWCTEDPRCSGSATKHFEGGSVNLSTLVPSCGCYDANVPHYLFKISNPQTFAIDGNSEEKYFNTIKKHIYKNGPILGGYLVFRNFRSGTFTKINGGVYLENCSYDSGGGSLKFSEQETSPENYVGSHAVAILGWGIQKGVIVDNNGTRKNVPYWYCRNSWTDNWGNNGYFKMAMYPYNKMSQFDKTVVIQAKGGRFGSGGVCLFNVNKPPEKLTLKQLDQRFLSAKRGKPSEFYSKETEDVIGTNSSLLGKSILSNKNLIKIVLLIGSIALLGFLMYMLMAKKTKKSLVLLTRKK